MQELNPLDIIQKIADEGTILQKDALLTIYDHIVSYVRVSDGLTTKWHLLGITCDKSSIFPGNAEEIPNLLTEVVAPDGTIVKELFGAAQFVFCAIPNRAYIVFTQVHKLLSNAGCIQLISTRTAVDAAVNYALKTLCSQGLVEFAVTQSGEILFNAGENSNCFLTETPSIQNRKLWIRGRDFNSKSVVCIYSFDDKSFDVQAIADTSAAQSAEPAKSDSPEEVIQETLDIDELVSDFKLSDTSQNHKSQEIDITKEFEDLFNTEDKNVIRPDKSK